MSKTARNAAEAMERIGRRDPTLSRVDFTDEFHSDAELSAFVDCLLANPDVITCAILALGQMSDKTGVKLARYVATSTTIQTLDLEDNKLGAETYLALAAALRVNSSLRVLYLFDNCTVDEAHVDEVFVDALRHNPNRPADSMWCLHEAFDDFPRLHKAAADAGHPTLQSLLNHELEKSAITSTRHVAAR